MRKQQQQESDYSPTGLDLEKINSQRITGLEQSIHYVEKKVDDLTRDLPKIVQDAVSQAVNTFGGNSPKSSSNSGNPALAIFITIILALGTVFGQQIFFGFQQNEKLSNSLKSHIEIAHQKDIELAVLQNEVKWIRFFNNIDEIEGKLKKVGQ